MNTEQLKQKVISLVIDALGDPEFDGGMIYSWNTEIGEFFVYFRDDGTFIVLIYKETLSGLREHACSEIEEFTRILKA